MPRVIKEPAPRKTFKEFLKESNDKDRAFRAAVLLFEHEIYKLIPGTRNPFRTDPGNTNTATMRHSHVYAKPKGQGKQLYSVNVDGSGHDGSSGVAIPACHAAYVRSQGYTIRDTDILESVDFDSLNAEQYALTVLQD
jgi:hypothetical protein